MYLNQQDFSQVIAHTPLFAIDLVVLNEHKQMLVGKRLNKPAKGSWFVPGGRILKGESLEQGFKRLTLNELGKSIELKQAKLLGLFEHFYKDSVFGDKISTHYINAAHLLSLQQDELKSLPTDEQHTGYRWMSLEEIEQDKNVHKYTRDYLGSLKQKLT